MKPNIREEGERRLIKGESIEQIAKDLDVSFALVEEWKRELPEIEKTSVISEQALQLIDLSYTNDITKEDLERLLLNSAGLLIKEGIRLDKDTNIMAVSTLRAITDAYKGIFAPKISINTNPDNDDGTSSLLNELKD